MLMGTDSEDQPAQSRVGELKANWALILGSFGGMMMGVGSVPFYLLGPLIKPMQAEFGWSAIVLPTCSSLLALGVTLGSPLVGKLADQRSPRLIAIVSLLALAACFFMASLVQNPPWQMMLAYFLMGLLGSGSSAIIYTRTIGARMERARGLAIGIVVSATGVTSTLAPLLVLWVDDAVGWRGVGVTVGCLILAIGLPAVWLGLPSVVAAPSHSGQRDAAEVETIRQLRNQAFRSRRFHLLCASIALFAILITASIINIVPLLTDRGVPAARAAEIASVMGIALLIGRLGIGTLLDHFQPALVGATIFLLGAAGALSIGHGEAASLFAVFCIGLLTGAEVDIVSVIALRCFDVRAYGSIFGVLMSVYTGTTIIGPFVGYGLFELGSYELLYSADAAALVAGAVLLVILSRLMRKDVPAHG
jgi:MFS family permease